MFKAMVFLSMFAAPIAAAAPSFAAEHPETPATEPATVLSLRGTPGAFFTPDQEGGAQIGVEALARHGWLLAGGSVALSSTLFGSDDVAGGPELGVAIPTPRWARVEVVAVGGARHYMGVGRGLLTANPGVDGTLPYLGVRTHLGLELGRTASRFSLGLQPFLQSDIGRLYKTHTYREIELFSTATHEVTATEKIGALRGGVTLALGGTFGL